MFRLGICWALALCCGFAARAAEPIQLRMETLTVPPATGPLAHVVAHNPGTMEYEGQLSLSGPADWRLSPATRPLKLSPGETRRIAFNIVQGRNVAANRYAFEIAARSGSKEIIQRQETFVASAPYLKVAVDGRADEWQDAVPITFRTADRRTTVSTCWDRRRFYLLVEVEEEQLRPCQVNDQPAEYDAVQFSISPLEPLASSPTAGLAGRFEFLLTSLPDGAARCFRLAEPASRIEDCLRPRPLGPCSEQEVEAAVRRDGGVTVYECSLAFAMFGEHLRPAEGREFHFSVLVHDPDGTGIRDLGRAAGLWPTPEAHTQWSRWPGARWEPDQPLGNQIRWGLSSSIH